MNEDINNISIVIPSFNEQGSLLLLLQEISRVKLDDSYQIQEVLVVDDGSTDETQAIFNQNETASKFNFNTVYVQLAKRTGKSHALSVGFRKATGDIIVTMDADLQDDPSDISKLISKIKEGYDLVSGWKRDRKDPIGKTLPSKIFNKTLKIFSGLDFHDFNCGLKAYKKESLRKLNLRGDLHRFIPIILHEKGYKVTEVATNHRPRQFGSSKYGFKRIFTGLLDFLFLLVSTRFIQKPGHFFGGIGLLIGSISSLSLFYLGILWLLDLGPIGNRPLFIISCIGALIAVQFVLFGVLAELLVPGVVSKRSDIKILQEKVIKTSKY